MNIDELMHPNDRAKLTGVTNEQIVAAFGILLAIGDTIQALGSVPSGELYARVMGKVDIGTYNAAIDKLKSCDLITESAHVLTWIGPKREKGN